MKPIAHIENDYTEKFGIPRQSGLVNENESVIIFDSEYSVPEAFRGIEEFSHLWIIWQFSENESKEWSPTVRPPKLGGNKRMGVFATRSPFRPNPIGLSCVELKEVIKTESGITLKVKGADLMNGTPVYDIKPYLAYTDSHPEASKGFADDGRDENRLLVVIPEEAFKEFPSDKTNALKSVLSLDPRPGYSDDPERVYGLSYAGFNIKFNVDKNILTVTDIIKVEKE